MSWRAGGVRPWVVQRLSAVYLAVFMLVFVVMLAAGGPLNFAAWHDLLAQPVMNVAAVLFWLALLGHAWVGGRDVIMDYVSADALRFSLLGLLALFLIAMMVWMLKIFLVL